jgi:hypothetical protein
MKNPRKLALATILLLVFVGFVWPQEQVIRRGGGSSSSGQPASANLTNWSNIGTNEVVYNNQFSIYTNEIKLQYQAGSQNLTNLSGVTTNEITFNNEFRNYTNYVYTNYVTITPSATVKTDTFSLNSTTFTDITGLNVSVTPSTSGKRVFITVSICVGMATSTSAQFRLMRGATPIDIGDAAGSRTQVTAEAFPNSASIMEHVSFSFIDSPATGSATTYSVQMRGQAAGQIYINRTVTDTDSATFPRGSSTIMAWEVN